MTVRPRPNETVVISQSGRHPDRLYEDTVHGSARLTTTTVQPHYKLSTYPVRPVWRDGSRFLAVVDMHERSTDVSLPLLWQRSEIGMRPFQPLSVHSNSRLRL